MATLNQLSCDIQRVWLGKNRCSVNMAAPKGLIGLPHGTEISAANMAALQTYLNGLLTDDDIVDRAIVISSIVGVEDNSEEAVNFTYPDGSNIQTRDEVYRLRFEHHEGWCYHKNMLDLNGTESQYDWLLFDQNNVIWGQLNTAGDALMGVVASQFVVHKMTMPTFDAPARYMFTFEVSDTTQLNENGGFVNAGFNLVSGLDSIQGVDLALVSWVDGAAGTVNVSADTACGGLNMAVEFAAELDAPGAWEATNAATGNAITITAVSVVTISGKPVFLFDFDATDPDYPASAASLYLRLQDVSVIAALGVEFYESNTLTLTRP